MMPQSPGSSEQRQSPFWKRPKVVGVLIVMLAVMLVAGSLLTGRGGLFGKRPAPVAAEIVLKTGDPNVLAPSGEKLLTVAEPPRQTRMEIKLSKDLGKPTFTVEFQPYGLTAKREAVVRLDQVSAQGGNTLASQFAGSLVGQNLLATVALDSSAALKVGGTYSGELLLVDRAGTSTFSLTGVKRVK